MNDTRYDLAGALVYWAFGAASELGKLQECLDRHGFAKHCPERMTDGAALKAALSEEFPGHKVFQVLSEKDKDRFEVVRVAADDTEKNRYTHVLTASLKLGLDARQHIETDEYDFDRDRRLEDAVERLTSMVPVGQLSKCMVEIVMALGGTTMRPSGGIYWIGNEHWDRWVALVDDITACGSKNRFDACRVVMDENCIEALRQALTNEIEREAKSIHESIFDPETGTRAAKTARKRAESLRAKIGSYESSFGIVLGELREALDNATTIETNAMFLDIAGAVAENMALSQ